MNPYPLRKRWINDDGTETIGNVPYICIAEFADSFGRMMLLLWEPRTSGTQQWSGNIAVGWGENIVASRPADQGPGLTES